MHVAITGASAGIGEAIARAYAAHGAQLTLVARRKDRLEQIAKESGASAFIWAADLADVARSTDWLRPCEEANGPIDVLVNNAGVQIVAPATRTSPDDGERLFRVDVHSPMRLTLAVLPSMIARKSGTIVDIASMAAITPTPGMYYYNAAKAALAAASESLRWELRGTGVHVLTVYPGPVDTDMARSALAVYESKLANRMPAGTTDELARIVVRAVEKKRSRIIYPRVYTATRWLPNLSRWLTGRFAPPIKND
jgi:short-subunit dehydrogenase